MLVYNQRKERITETVVHSQLKQVLRQMGKINAKTQAFMSLKAAKEVVKACPRCLSCQASIRHDVVDALVWGCDRMQSMMECRSIEDEDGHMDILSSSVCDASALSGGPDVPRYA